MRGKGELILTGQLGDVMKESARAAWSYARVARRGRSASTGRASSSDVHIHVPAGAIPKDGPSAGVTMATALVSALSGRPARHDVAMTGEITLSGRVLPIGGVKEKVLGAVRAGITHIVLPKENEADLEDLPRKCARRSTSSWSRTWARCSPSRCATRRSRTGASSSATMRATPIDVTGPPH